METFEFTDGNRWICSSSWRILLVGEVEGLYPYVSKKRNKPSKAVLSANRAALEGSRTVYVF